MVVFLVRQPISTSKDKLLTTGDDPPRDRTGELRKLGFEGRHLKEVQMTTDTAVGVSKRVVEDKGTRPLLLKMCS